MRCRTWLRAALITMLLGVLSRGTLNASGVSAAPPAPPGADTVGDVASTIDAMLEILNNTYVFPEIAAKMEKAIRAHQKAGRYDSVTDDTQIATMLTEDLKAVYNDQHLRVRAGAMRQGPKPTPEQIKQQRDEAQRRNRNYGFEKSEKLPGNIGYIKFNMFQSSEEAKQVAAKIIESLLDTDALIFDVRDNVGGSPTMVVFLSSYLFDESIHLISFYNRLAEQSNEYWTLAEVPGGVKYGEDKPVYVLTSSTTFSAAEGFTYHLRSFKRATVVGEQTRGGAHPVRNMKINDRFRISVPFARAVNPVTGTNWEGVGVEPHVRTSREEALRRAQIHALSTLIEHNSDRPQKVKEWEAARKMLQVDS